ncbi:MAG: hypothetical protein R6V35_03095 [Candidatus Nanohaloarchaea archaeon]
MVVEQIMSDAMNNPEILIGGVVIGYAAGAMMTKRKMMRRGGMGMGGGF